MMKSDIFDQRCEINTKRGGKKLKKMYDIRFIMVVYTCSVVNVKKIHFNEHGVGMLEYISLDFSAF